MTTTRKQVVPGVVIAGPEGTDPVLDPFRTAIMKRLLAFQVGQVIFCPGAHCDGALLDARRAVGLGSHVVCTTCWGSLTPEQQQMVVRAASETTPTPTELLDGPALHGREPVIPALEERA
jgi:hypothetical protein